MQEIDEYFLQENIVYVRYSDDILFFAEKEKIAFYKQKLEQMIAYHQLSLNPEKICMIQPGDKWEFLGFSYENGKIDISSIAKDKIKGKIKRLSRKLRRWMLRKNATCDRAISAVIRKMNRKFYQLDNKTELTWQLWYFPVINTADGLHEIDLYMQDCLRYIKTGKYQKKNYNLRYAKLKELGYRPLKSEYYKFRKLYKEK